MLKLIISSFSNTVKIANGLNPWTNVYGLARTFLALSLFITLIVTGHQNLFPNVNGELLRGIGFDFEKISIFYLFKHNLAIAWALSLFILVFVMSGFLPQLSGILHWWAAYSYYSSGIVIEGGDQIAMILTLFLVPVCLSDPRTNHWNKPKDGNRKAFKLFVWSVYAIISLQVSIIYLHAAIAKMSVDEWVNGTAIYYWFTHETFGVSDSIKVGVAHLLSNVWVVISITWGAMLLEMILFGWIFMKRNSWNWKLLFISGVLFHFMIALIQGLVSFMLTMIGALILYLYPKSHHLKFKLWT
ncbi:sporulation-delaying protein SdpB family protein [Maribacter luteus]|uniref:sporulation-delaying protein SdpB family protein n=1 Tax=Maribacter luteus TaxID=2594478 RepID=UPI0024920B0F|nr:sporulation-delaying protein SdpB family protein [Maribacter luteus]